MYIQSLVGLQILDSRGIPTVACKITLSDGSFFCASVPSGASVGAHEAFVLRDDDFQNFMGNGVLKAVAIINTQIAPLLVNKEPNLFLIDAFLIEANFPANSTLAVSMAVARAHSWIMKIPLYIFLREVCTSSKLHQLRCMFNIINGGAHVDNGPLFQEFMIVPRFDSINNTLNTAVTIYYALKTILAKEHKQTTTGDEGGFTLCLSHKSLREDENILELIIKAIEHAGFRVGVDVDLALDCAATQFYNKNLDKYFVYGDLASAHDMIAYYKSLLKKYPIISLEDPLAEDDWDSWVILTQEIGNHVQLVGDDIFVTQLMRIKEGITKGVGNAVLIKPNQVGTVTKALQAISYAFNKKYSIVVSHRSGETTDDFITDLAYAVGANFFKAGAPVHGERVVKYNRLLAIEAGW